MRLPLALALITLTAACTPASEQLPNFVVILVDDLGYADIASFGSEQNRTPHLDRMAVEGLRFTDFHSNGPMCTPTRAALLTGLYPHRFGEQFEGALSGIDDYETGLPHAATTIAEVLQGAGYVSGMFGKWHLGYRPPYMPLDHGFDVFRGLGSGDGDHHTHIDRSGRPDWWHGSKIAMEAGYSVDLITKHSVEFIESNKDRPFFLYVAHLAIHFPWQGPDDPGYRVEGGNYHNLSKLGPHVDLDASSYVKNMVEAVDGSVGEILSAVEANRLDDRTLVFFTSDNGGYRTYQGGYHNISENGPLRGQKTEMYEGGHRVPAIAWWPGRIDAGITAELAATFDIFPTVAALAGCPTQTDIDGTDLSPVLFSGQSLTARTLFWRMRSSGATRRGSWKLVQHDGQEPELYDLTADLGETQNVAQEFPDVAAELGAEFEEWSGSIGR